MKTPWEMEKREFITAVCCFVCLFLITFNIVSVSSNLGSIQEKYGVAYPIVSAFSQILAISYLIFFMISISFTDKMGKKVSILTGLSIFAVMSVLCAIAWDMASLIIFRLICGIGVSLIQTSCLSILTDNTPSKYLGDAMAAGYSFSSIGAIAAPLIGYNLVQMVGTWIIFIFAAPVCLILIYLLRNIDNIVVRPDLRINYPFHTIYAVSVSLIIMSLMNMTLTYRLILFLAGAALFAAAIIVHKKSKTKVFNMGILRNRTFLLCIVLIFMYQYASSGVENSVNHMFQFVDADVDFFGIMISTAALAAVLISFKPAIQAITAPIIARYYRNRDQKIQSIIGLALLILSCVLAILLFQTGESPISIIMIFIVYTMHAISSSFFTPYNKKVMMASVSPEDRNIASSFSGATGTLASIFGVITLINILNSADNFDSMKSSTTLVYVIVLVISILGILIAMRAKNRWVVESS